MLIPDGFKALSTVCTPVLTSVTAFGLSSSLLFNLHSLFAPGKIYDRYREEAVAVVDKSSQSIVISREGGKYPKHPPGNLQTSRNHKVPLAFCVALAGKEQVAQIQSDKEEDKGNCGSQCAQQEDCGEDEPASEVESDRRVQSCRVRGVWSVGSISDAPGWCEEKAIR